MFTLLLQPQRTCYSFSMPEESPLEQQLSQYITKVAYSALTIILLRCLVPTNFRVVMVVCQHASIEICTLNSFYKHWLSSLNVCFGCVAAVCLQVPQCVLGTGWWPPDLKTIANNWVGQKTICHSVCCLLNLQIFVIFIMKSSEIS